MLKQVRKTLFCFSADKNNPGLDSLAEDGEFAKAVIQQRVRAVAGRSPGHWEDHDALSTRAPA